MDEFTIDFTNDYINNILRIRSVDVLITDRKEISVKGAGPLNTTLGIYLTDRADVILEDPDAILGPMVQDRLIRARELCSICGTEAPYEVSAARLRPWICDDEMCSQIRDRFGAGIDPLQELLHNPEMVHLLLTLGSVNDDKDTSLNCRVLLDQLIFPPWPITDSGREVVTHTGAPVSGRNKLQLRKVIGACQTYLRYSGRQVKDGHTMHAFDVVDFNARHLAEFQQASKNHGCSVAYHGSSASKWLYILNGGLRNMSGTKGQVNGAAFGSGIYLAEDFSLAHGYAGGGRGLTGSPDSITMVAECEAINIPTYRHQWHGGNSYIRVVPKNEHVRVIRLLVLCSRFG